jgi:hypothetical protein
VIERIYCSPIDQSNAIIATEDKEVNQKFMADFYADCLIADAIAIRDGLTRVDFGAVNAAILKRWPKGLNRIKEMAWKIARNGVRKGV